MSAYEMKCADLGMDCKFEIRSEDKEQLLRLTGTHAKETHGKDESPELNEAVSKVIREVS